MSAAMAGPASVPKIFAASPASTPADSMFDRSWVIETTSPEEFRVATPIPSSSVATVELV